MQRIEAADFHELAQLGDPRVSPDGETVAFLRRVPNGDEEYESTIYLVPIGGGEPSRFTLTEGVDSEPRFSPDGTYLAFVSTRGGDTDRPQLWVVPTDGGEGRQLTSLAGGVSEISWRPDSESIAFVQQVSAEDRDAERDQELPEEYEPDPPDPRVIERTVYRSMERYFDGKYAQIYTVDIATEEISRLTTADRDHSNPTWRDDSTLYYTIQSGEPDPDDSIEYDIVAHDIVADERDSLHSTSSVVPKIAVASTGRIAYLYCESDQASLQQIELRVLDTDGAVQTPTESLDRTLGYEPTIQWDSAEETLFFTTPDEGADAIWSVDWDETTPERVVREEWASIHGCHVGDDIIAFVKSEWDHPGDLFITSPGGAEQHRLTRLNAEYLDGRAVAQPEAITYENDGVELQGWVLRPPDFDASEQYPLAVNVHGGPHIMWTTSESMWHEFQTLAARGYVVFWSNPRGSAGYGADHLSAIERDWGEVTMSDIMAGVETVGSREYIDEDQLFLTGGSFGGYMTSWIVSHTDAFEAAVTQRGVYDLIGFYGSTDSAYSLVEGDFNTTPWEEPAFLWEHSPTGHAHNVDTPTLVMHSDDDYRTPANTAELFYRILRKHRVPTRMVRYPNEGHELSRSGQPKHIVDRLERILRWFDGYSEYHESKPALERDADAGLSHAASGDEQ